MRVSSLSPAVTRELKRLVYDAGSRPLASGLRQEAASGITAITSSAAKQELTAYGNALKLGGTLDDDTIVDIWQARGWSMRTARRPPMAPPNASGSPVDPGTP